MASLPVDHIARMPDESDAKQILTASSLENWRRPPGRPVLCGWRLPSRTWNQWTSPWMKRLTWLSIAHSGDWCLRLALCTHSGACQKWWWWWLHSSQPQIINTFAELLSRNILLSTSNHGCTRWSGTVICWRSMSSFSGSFVFIMSLARSLSPSNSKHHTSIMLFVVSIIQRMTAAVYCCLWCHHHRHTHITLILYLHSFVSWVSSLDRPELFMHFSPTWYSGLYSNHSY